MILLSEEDIYNRGIISNVALTLDDGDMRYPSGHWANSTGTRMYCIERVEWAECLKKYFDGKFYYHIDAETINNLSNPVTEPIIIFDYRIIAKSLRKHNEPTPRPFGHYFYEQLVRVNRPFVISDIINICNFAFSELNITNENELILFLDKISEDLQFDFPETKLKAIARKQVLKRNISQGRSKVSAIKTIKWISLLQKNIVDNRHIQHETLDLFEFLTVNPIIRIDHKVMNPLV